MICLGVLEVFDVLRSIEPEYPGHFSIPSIFAWFMIQRSAYDLHCMKCILWSQLGMGQKASPQNGLATIFVDCLVPHS